MDHIDALNDLKRSKRKCGTVFNNELDDFRRLVNEKDGLNSSYQEFLRFVLDNAGIGRDDIRKRECTTYIDEDESDEEDEDHRDHEDQLVKTNKILLLQVKVEGQKAGTSIPVSEKLRNSAHPTQKGVKAKIQTKRKLPDAIPIDDANEDAYSQSANQVDLPGPKEPSKQSSKAGTSKPVPEKLHEKAKRLQIKVKVEETTDTSNPVSAKMSERAPPSQLCLKAKSHKQMKSPEVIVIDDDDEDLHTPSGQKDKGKSVVFEIPEVEILDNAAFSTKWNPFVPSKRYRESLSNENDETQAFRNDVLKVLREPFNPNEYEKLYKEFIGGSYHVHYEDVKKKLHRVRREKRWIILRGFFFWLQNLAREGAFRPWTDPDCLEVEPVPWE